MSNISAKEMYLAEIEELEESLRRLAEFIARAKNEKLVPIDNYWPGAIDKAVIEANHFWRTLTDAQSRLETFVYQE